MESIQSKGGVAEKVDAAIGNVQGDGSPVVRIVIVQVLE